jgi:hypothetical protein
MYPSCRLPERLLLPDPVLQHLARRLDKITLHGRAEEARQLRARAEVVHHVAELVEVGLHLAMVEERGPLRRVLGKVAEHRRHRLLLLPVRPEAALRRKLCTFCSLAEPVERQHFAGAGAGCEVFWPGSGSGYVNLFLKNVIFLTSWSRSRQKCTSCATLTFCQKKMKSAHFSSSGNEYENMSFY